MKAKHLFERLTEDWPVKVVCLVVALFLYGFYQNQNLDRKVFSVPLRVETKNGFVPTEPHPAVVAVSVTGKADELAQVRDSDLRAYLDLSYVAKAGTFDFPVLLELSDSASILNPMEIKISPESVSLSVEEIVSGFADVSPLIRGKPASGYELRSVSAVPEQIEITGPRTMVENCKSIQTKSISVEGARKSFSADAAVEQRGMFISSAGTSVSVKVEIGEVQGSRLFKNVPVNLINIDPLLEIAAMTGDVPMTLTGSVIELDSFVPGTFTILADCRNIHEGGTFDIALSYSLPDNFALADGFVKSVPVTFVLRKGEPELPAVIEEKVMADEAEGKNLEQVDERGEAR